MARFSLLPVALVFALLPVSVASASLYLSWPTTKPRPTAMSSISRSTSPSTNALRIVQTAVLLVQMGSIRGAQSKRGVGAGPVAAARKELGARLVAHRRRISRCS
jgi:hypothetical protein